MTGTCVADLYSHIIARIIRSFRTAVATWHQNNALAMAKILVKCEGNNLPKYDGKIWEEELKFVVSINEQTVDLHRQSEFEVKPGDRVVICRPGKGGKKGRNWKGTVMSQSDLANKSLQPGPNSSSS